jgi:hypothetical protein
VIDKLPWRRQCHRTALTFPPMCATLRRPVWSEEALDDISTSIMSSSNNSINNSTNGSSNVARRWTLLHCVVASMALSLIQMAAHPWLAVRYPSIQRSKNTSRNTSSLRVANGNSSSAPQHHDSPTMLDSSHDHQQQHDENSNDTKLLETYIPTFTDPIEYKWEGIEDMRYFAQSFFEGSNIYCDRIQQQRQQYSHNHSTTVSISQVPPPLPLLQMTISFGCAELFHKSGYGTGNYLSLLYALRLTTAVHDNVSLNLTCHDADETKADLIVPWLTGYQPPRLSSMHPTHPYPMVSPSDSCASYHTSPIAAMIPDMQYDLRRMALGLVGIDTDHAASTAWAKQHNLVSSPHHDSHQNNTDDPSYQLHVPIDVDQPVYRLGIDIAPLDDAVIHFRCGDLMDSEHPNFAFVRFASYARHIAPNTTSIGILTQPFQSRDTDQTRPCDATDTMLDRCRTVVMALVDYLQQRHPNARITIHNGPRETIALAYARMILAQQTLAGLSTFGIFPVLATFGTAYLHQPRGPQFVNGWLFRGAESGSTSSNHITTIPGAPHVHLTYEDDYIMVADMKRKWETQGADGVVAWFRSEPHGNSDEASNESNQ